LIAATPQSRRDRPSAEPRSSADRILAAAEALFAERGFAGTAVRDIAQRADLNPGSLYNHFEGKQALYEAVLERGLQPIFEILDHAADPAAPPSKSVLEALMQHLAASPNLARLIQHETLAGGDQALGFVRRWLSPVYARATEALRRSPGVLDWDEEEFPLLLMTYHHLIFGHFALAGALGEVLDVDLLSPDAVDRHTRFLGKVTEKLFGLSGADGAGDNAEEPDRE
jgi:TetR/AcrR family transcriptional regulator